MCIRCLVICLAEDFMLLFSFAPCDIRVATNLKLGFSTHNAFVSDFNSIV
jgi:hypothetical protein